MTTRIFKDFTCLLFFMASGVLSFAQSPQVINWNKVTKQYNKDSSQMKLLMNNRPMEGSFKDLFENDGYSIFTIKKGLITGTFNWFYKDGSKDAIINYKNGVRNGITEFYDNEGNVRIREEYVAGRKQGLQETFRRNEPLTKTFYKADKKNGTDQRFISGRLSSETNYKDDVKHGISKTFDTEGKVIFEESYLDGVLDGLSKTYMQGMLATTITYKIGQKTGLVTMYANGVKNMDFEMLNGKRHGVSHMYKPDGGVQFTNYFLNDEKVTKEQYEGRK